MDALSPLALASLSVVHMLTRVRSATVVGVEASAIDVEVHLASGLPGCHIVGLPDAGVKEGRVRIRGALDSCGFKLTPPPKVTVNLAPADGPAQGRRRVRRAHRRRHPDGGGHAARRLRGRLAVRG
jgi:hypothetical protein